MKCKTQTLNPNKRFLPFKIVSQIRASVTSRAAVKLANWEHSNPNKTASHVQKAIFKAESSPSIVAFWRSLANIHPRLSQIMERMHSSKPASTACERINSMNKLLQSPLRGSLTHAKLKKLLYSFVNLRLLDDVDEEIHDLISSAVNIELELEGAAQAGSSAAPIEVELE